MSKKPIIRHCRNCEWGQLFLDGDIKCQVTFKYFIYNSEQRRKALFCRYYKQKGSEENAVD